MPKRFRKPAQDSAEDCLDDRFTKRTETERGKRDSQLRRRKICVEIVQQPEQSNSTLVAVCRERLDARTTDTDERKLRGDKETVCQDEYKYQEDLDGRRQKRRRFGNCTGLGSYEEKGQTSGIIHLGN